MSETFVHFTQEMVTF